MKMGKDYDFKTFNDYIHNVILINRLGILLYFTGKFAFLFPQNYPGEAQLKHGVDCESAFCTQIR